MQLTFYTHGLCPYAQRVALALQWLELPHETIEVDLSNKPSWYAQRLGTSLVPAIELDGKAHAESLDICRLLNERAGRALVAGEESSHIEHLIRRRTDIESAGWHLLGGSWSFSRKPATPAAREEWERAVGLLTESVRAHGGRYLWGDKPTLADAVIAPFVARFELAALRVKGYDARRATPELDAYLRALEADEGWCATYPQREPFGDAIQRYASLDYFDYHTASLAEPLPASA